MTAFQADAFQNDAFQIATSVGGGDSLTIRLGETFGPQPALGETWG